MIRDLSEEFLPNKDLSSPVRVFHEKFQPNSTIQDESIIFILNPVKLSQQELRFLIQHNACIIFLKTDFTTGTPVEQHPIKQLLNNQNVNEHLQRIKGLHKNIVELHIEKNKWWDFLGITVSYKQLFSINDMGFCFMEYPIISEDTLTLDDVFIQESIKSMMPMDIINKYLEIIENGSNSNVEAMNIRNAFQKVFRFYKSQENVYQFNRKLEDLTFLVEVLRLDDLSDNLQRKATIIGALTAACAYFIHSGHPESYNLVIEKLLELSLDSNEKILKYKYISKSDLQQLRNRDSFLYYHLTCRIPNQYTIALFDQFLIETDVLLKQKYEMLIDSLLHYLKKQSMELSLLAENLLWEFKRDQEIGAMAGTIGQIILYKDIGINGNVEAFDEAEKYLKRALEYAHFAEKSRNVNYIIQCRLWQIIHCHYPQINNSCIKTALYELAAISGKNFSQSEHYKTFDVMFSIAIIAAATITLSADEGEEVYRRIGLDWENIDSIVDAAPHLYAAYLLVAYLLFTPLNLIDHIDDIHVLIEKARLFFKLNDPTYTPKSVMDLIALKFMLAHAWFLNFTGNDKEHEILEAYKKKIEDSLIFTKWKHDYAAYIDECIEKKASAAKGLQLIYTIPY